MTQLYSEMNEREKVNEMEKSGWEKVSMREKLEAKIVPFLELRALDERKHLG